jgi:hypothetical protein
MKLEQFAKLGKAMKRPRVGMVMGIVGGSVARPRIFVLKAGGRNVGISATREHSHQYWE